MATKTKQWTDGSSATIQYDGQGDGQIIITSDPNNHYEARSMQITVETTNGSPKQTKIITINQAAKQRIDLSAAVVTASNQTYNGSAKTPTPTVTLNGSTVPSTGYDVAYSNNTNAGTATITVTGKGEYTGTATGTFTINKASRTLSFADSYMVLNTSSTGTKTATPSAGSGDGAITYSIANTTYATINSSSGKVTSKTADGSATVTATIAEGTNYLSASTSYTLYVFATTHNYSYNGSYRSVTLPPGTYQFQVWGAQGAACSDGKAGGKGGYSVGQLTLSQPTGIRVYVGGQNGYNGGGSSTGSSSFSNSAEYGRSSMGNGGGASDIRLSDGSLYSRMIVAGGGSGGAYGYQEKYTQVPHTDTLHVSDGYDCGWVLGGTVGNRKWWKKDTKNYGVVLDVSAYKGGTISAPSGEIFGVASIPNASSPEPLATSTTFEIIGGGTATITSSTNYIFIYEVGNGTDISPSYFTITYTTTTTETAESDPVPGHCGGGTVGGAWSSLYEATQTKAGSNGSFGQGANQTVTNKRYCSAAGGGGWYGGGGGQYENNYLRYVYYSGGGSGWVNIAASAGNRPSGYTGLELDSGATYAGNTSFPAPGGGNETGHSGDGYIRITRIS